MISTLFSIWGDVNNPTNYGNFDSGGPGQFISNIIKFVIVIAGLYAVFNFILAGYDYLSAGGDPKKIASATSKIWQSLIGLVLVVAAFVIGGLISQILFGDTGTIFEINITGPN